MNGDKCFISKVKFHRKWINVEIIDEVTLTHEVKCCMFLYIHPGFLYFSQLPRLLVDFIGWLASPCLFLFV